MSTAIKEKIAIKPVGQRVLLRRLESGDLSTGGIVIPDRAREKPEEAEVLATGTGGRNEDGEKIPFQVKAGDRVLLSKYGGTEVKHHGEELVIAEEKDILAIVES